MVISVEDWSDVTNQKKLPVYKKDEFGIEFVNQYKKVYSHYQHNTPHIGQAMLHLIMGQMPHQKDMRIQVDANYLDTRIHIVWFQPQSSGKGRAYNLAGNLSDRVGLKYKVVTELTDAALIGGWKKVQRYVPEKKAQVEEYELKSGLLTKGECNILAMNEASILFDTAQTSIAKHAMDFYQVAMNTHGTKDNTISKDVMHGNGPIEVTPDCSLFLTSYIPQRFSHVIATRGFASRTLNIINAVTPEDRYQVQLYSAKNFNVEKEQQLFDISEISNKLLFIDNFYKGVHKFQNSQGVTKSTITFAQELKDTLSDVSKFHKNKLEEFTIRFQEIGYKTMYHSCCLRLGTRIEQEDVAYAHQFLMPIWQKFIMYMEESLTQNIKDKQKESAIEEDIYNTYIKILNTNKVNDKNGFIPRPLFKKYLKIKVWKCSDSTADKRIVSAEKSGLLDKSKTHRTPMIKIVRKPEVGI